MFDRCEHDSIILRGGEVRLERGPKAERAIFACRWKEIRAQEWGVMGGEIRLGIPKKLVLLRHRLCERHGDPSATKFDPRMRLARRHEAASFLEIGDVRGASRLFCRGVQPSFAEPVSAAFGYILPGEPGVPAAVTLRDLQALYAPLSAAKR